MTSRSFYLQFASFYSDRYVAFWAALPALALIGLVTISPAAAQDVRTLSNRLDLLQKELSVLKGQVYQGGGAVSGSSGAANIAAGQEVRLQQLENQINLLNGQIEQLAYELNRVKEQQQKFAEDVEFRLQEIEQKTGLSAFSGDNQTAPQGADIATPPSNEETGNTAPGAAAPAGGVGTATGTNSGGAGQTVLGADRGAKPLGVIGGNTADPNVAAKEQYNYAFSLLRQQRYDEAQQLLAEFVQRYPQDELAGNAQYWLGETYYVRNDYQNAAVAFAEGYQKYPNSSKAPDNLLKLGMSLANNGNSKDACRVFTELQKRYASAPPSLLDRARSESARNNCS